MQNQEHSNQAKQYAGTTVPTSSQAKQLRQEDQGRVGLLWCYHNPFQPPMPWYSWRNCFAWDKESQRSIEIVAERSHCQAGLRRGEHLQEISV